MEGLSETPLNFIPRCKGDSVGLFSAYPLLKHSTTHSGDERLRECFQET